jgi:hypothetical protein
MEEVLLDWDRLLQFNAESLVTPNGSLCSSLDSEVTVNIGKGKLSETLQIKHWIGQQLARCHVIDKSKKFIARSSSGLALVCGYGKSLTVAC